jgi:isopentenyl phosphate kinase
LNNTGVFNKSTIAQALEFLDVTGGMKKHMAQAGELIMDGSSSSA